jgi:hypothetical protein
MLQSLASYGSIIVGIVLCVAGCVVCLMEYRQKF